MKKFADAFHGLRDGWNDRGVRTQILMVLPACTAGFILRFSFEEWLAVLLCFGLVISLEMINTCIERVCDLITEEYDERIRLIKDLAAGAVLTASLISFLIALMIFIRRFV
ncbi:MAG: diacylglycerol kinase family protein [Solobacterium sp.]|nr:diacylglycerol kinase family protein [Solobacterium sp.]